MLVLAIDTSTKVGTVALYSDKDGIIAEINLNCGNTHSENAMPAIDSLFKMAGVLPSEVDKIAVSTGPGSFTGIRIGVSLAKGLAYSLKKPIIGVNELDAIAALSGKVSQEMQVVPMIDARKERAYCGIYREIDGVLTLISQYKDWELSVFLEGIKNVKTLFLGDASINYRELIEKNMGKNAVFYSRALSEPRASLIAELALVKDEDNIMTLEPYYVNKTQAEREKEMKN